MTKNRNDKKQNGFSLLEVILAMAMVSVILLAASHLDIVAARLTNSTDGEVALRNDILYGLRVMQKDIQAADEIVVQPLPDPSVENQSPVNNAHYEFTLKHSDGSPDIVYVIDFTPALPQPVLTRDGENVLPAGVTPKLKYTSANTPQSPFLVVNGKIVTLNFAAETTPVNGFPALSSSASKSILIRTGTINLLGGGS